MFHTRWVGKARGRRVEITDGWETKLLNQPFPTFIPIICCHRCRRHYLHLCWLEVWELLPTAPTTPLNHVTSFASENKTGRQTERRLLLQNGEYVKTSLSTVNWRSPLTFALSRVSHNIFLFVLFFFFLFFRFFFFFYPW